MLSLGTKCSLLKVVFIQQYQHTVVTPLSSVPGAAQSAVRRPATRKRKARRRHQCDAFPPHSPAHPIATTAQVLMRVRKEQGKVGCSSVFKRLLALV